MPDFFFLA